MNHGCAFCDEEGYGGTVAFRGVQVVEQTMAFDLCENHWLKFWKEANRAGWIPHDLDAVRTVQLYEENGYSFDVIGDEVHEVEVRTDDSYNGQWRLTDETEGREDVEVSDGIYLMSFRRKSSTDE